MLARWSKNREKIPAGEEKPQVLRVSWGRRFLRDSKTPRKIRAREHRNDLVTTGSPCSSNRPNVTLVLVVQQGQPMLRILGSAMRLCDRVTLRDMLWPAGWGCFPSECLTRGVFRLRSGAYVRLRQSQAGPAPLPLRRRRPARVVRSQAQFAGRNPRHVSSHRHRRPRPGPK